MKRLYIKLIILFLGSLSLSAIADPLEVVWVQDGDCGSIRGQSFTGHKYKINFSYLLSGVDEQGNQKSSSYSGSGQVDPGAGGGSFLHQVDPFFVDCKKQFGVTNIHWNITMDMTEEERLGNLQREEQGKANIRYIIERQREIQRENDEIQRIKEAKEAKIRQAIELRHAEEASAREFAERGRRNDEEAKRNQVLAVIRSHPECNAVTLQDLQWCLKQKTQEKAIKDAENIDAEKVRSQQAKNIAAVDNDMSRLRGQMYSNPNCAFGSNQPQEIPYPPSAMNNPAEKSRIDAINAQIRQTYQRKMDATFDECMKNKSGEREAIRAQQIKAQEVARKKAEAEEASRMAAIGRARASMDEQNARSRVDVQNQSVVTKKMQSNNSELSDLINGMK